MVRPSETNGNFSTLSGAFAVQTSKPARLCVVRKTGEDEAVQLLTFASTDSGYSHRCRLNASLREPPFQRSRLAFAVSPKDFVSSKTVGGSKLVRVRQSLGEGASWHPKLLGCRQRPWNHLGKEYARLLFEHWGSILSPNHRGECWTSRLTWVLFQVAHLLVQTGVLAFFLSSRFTFLLLNPMAPLVRFLFPLSFHVPFVVSSF